MQEIGKRHRPRGATVARLTPDQKVACSNHVGVKGATMRDFCAPLGPANWTQSKVLPRFKASNLTLFFYRGTDKAAFGLHGILKSMSSANHEGTRTLNLLIRSQTPYPLGHVVCNMRFTYSLYRLAEHETGREGTVGHQGMFI